MVTYNKTQNFLRNPEEVKQTLSTSLISLSLTKYIPSDNNVFPVDSPHDSKWNVPNYELVLFVSLTMLFIILIPQSN